MVLSKVDFWEEKVLPVILEQYRSSAKWQGLLKPYIDMLTAIDGATLQLSEAFDIGKAEGVALDFIGSVFNIEREAGETDASYKARILEYVSTRNAGTPEFLIASAAKLTGDEKPQFIDEAPATCFIYTPGTEDEPTHQLTRAQVARLTPAGVLGLPGAAIETGNGALIHLAGRPEVRIICAAQDVTPPPPGDNLLTEEGEQLLTEDGEQIVLEESA